MRKELKKIFLSVISLIVVLNFVSCKESSTDVEVPKVDYNPNITSNVEVFKYNLTAKSVSITDQQTIVITSNSVKIDLIVSEWQGGTVEVLVTTKTGQNIFERRIQADAVQGASVNLPALLDKVKFTLGSFTGKVNFQIATVN